MKNRLNILNPKTKKAMIKWYSMNPIERVKTMKKVDSQKKTIKGKFGDIIKSLEVVQ